MKISAEGVQRAALTLRFYSLLCHGFIKILYLERNKMKFVSTILPMIISLWRGKF